MKCPRCNTRNPADAEFCRMCQFPLPGKGVHSTVKFCSRCRKTYQHAEGEFCPKCQFPLVERERSKLPVIVIASIIGVLVIVAGIGAIKIYPEYRFQQAIDQENTGKLAEICEKHPDLLDNKEFQELYFALVTKCADRYIEETVDYDQVSADFEHFSQINSHLLKSDQLRVDTEKKTRLIEEIHTSRIAYETAEEAFNAHRYKTAESTYPAVIEGDEKYYTLAQRNLLRISELKKSYLSMARQKADVKEYDRSLEYLTEGLRYFAYDQEYAPQYYEEIIRTVLAESDYLLGNEQYFSSGSENGAFNLIYSYLNDADYADQEELKSKLNSIAEASAESEIAYAVSELGLINQSEVLNRSSAKAAEDYAHDQSIQDNSNYILALCEQSAEVQKLISTIPVEKQVNVVLISDIAMTSRDFCEASREKVEQYTGYTWNYTGIGRYYNQEKREFSWAVIIIYETE